MPASRLSETHMESGLTDAAIPTESDLRGNGASSNAGQAFADLLVLGALACQTPVAILSVPQAGGGWSTLSHGFDQRQGLNDGQLFEAIAACPGPVEFADLVTSLPRSPLVQAPHSMRWAYGVALRDGSGAVVGVVVVMDRWLRQLTKREQRAMGALARQTVGHLSSLRRNAEVAEPRPILRRVPRNGISTPGISPKPVGLPHVEAPQLLRSHEVATIFDVTERTVINWAAAGKLPSLRTIGGHLRFRRDDVMRLLSGSEELP
jgi:excisionase family DNA binding protein